MTLRDLLPWLLLPLLWWSGMWLREKVNRNRRDPFK